MATPAPHHGTGPGPITDDGCAVEFYATLKQNGEPELIHAAIPAHATILELGAGTGRITRGLIGLGHEVVAVDQSPEMLAYVGGAETVCSAIETLRLGRTFDLVLLMSQMVDTPDDDQRDAFLRTCRVHLAEGGSVILQRHSPEWYDSATPFVRDTDDGRTFRMRDVSRPGPDLLSATMEYTVGDRQWTHSFVSKRQSDADLGAALQRAGLVLAGYLNDDDSWVRAVLLEGGPKPEGPSPAVAPPQ